MQFVYGAECADQSELMEQVWRFRHEQFVEKLRWDSLRQEDGREIDQFDHDEAIHLPLLHDERIVGYSRLLPTTRPHLLSDVYPEIMGGAAWPRGERVYEWTRCIGLPKPVSNYGAQATNLVSVGVVEFCLHAGIESLIVETHPKLAYRLMELGWDVAPLHPPVEFEGRPFGAIIARPTAQTLWITREAFGVYRPVLALTPAMPLLPGQSHVDQSRFEGLRSVGEANFGDGLPN